MSWQHCNVFLNGYPHLLHIPLKLCSCCSPQCDRQGWAVTKFIPCLWTQRGKGRGQRAPARFAPVKCQVLKQSRREGVKHGATKLRCQSTAGFFYVKLDLARVKKRTHPCIWKCYELLEGFVNYLLSPSIVCI